MADYTADSANSFAGGTLTKRTGTTSADTVAGGSYVIWVNAGAGAHVVTLANNKTDQGLAITSRTLTIPAGGARSGRIDPAVADANNRVAVSIDGTASEVTYYLINV